MDLHVARRLAGDASRIERDMANALEQNGGRDGRGEDAPDRHPHDRRRRDRVLQRGGSLFDPPRRAEELVRDQCERWSDPRPVRPVSYREREQLPGPDDDED
jgi:hypothetical protein